MKNLILLSIACCLSLTLQGQGRRLCRAMEIDSIRRAQNPALGSLDEFERAMQYHIAREDKHLEARMLLTLPVIVHVVHSGEPVGTGSNISFDQVMSQFEVLEEDFRKKSGTPGFNNDPVGADIELEFCPATLDPNGDPLLERGINRIDRNTFSWIAPPWNDTYFDNNIKPQTFWDPDRYLNIWVAELSGNVLGYAQFPNMAGINGLPANNGGASTDGVVVAPTFFGRRGNVASPYDEGRTTTHEIGHWLGIFHLEGRDRGGCSQDDFCDDTPQTDNKNFGCDPGHVSCGTTDMVRNYMDASDDACMNIFTQCQKTRMRTVIDNSPRRGILANANSCTEDLPPAVAISPGSSIICAGQSIRFSDASVNDPDEWNWSFPGGIPASSTDRNPVVVYPNAGIYSVSLEAGNAFGNRRISLTDVITVNSNDPSPVFEEDFENGIPSDWVVDNPDSNIGWTTQPVGGVRAGNQTAFVELYFYPGGARDGLISPSIDLSQVSNLKLSFDHAYVQETGSERDSLIVYASTDGGNSFPDVLIRLGDDGMQSFATSPPTGANPGPFVPTQDSDWCYSGDGASCIELDIDEYAGESQFALRFETVSDFGNNIYLDNIQIEGTCKILSINPALASIHNFKAFPNPNQGLLNISLENLRAKPLSISLFSLMGEEMYTKDMGIPSSTYRDRLDISALPAGPYLIKLRIGEEEVYEKLMLN
ncbi:MAG: M43 family zinc metalloprotease [Bacteroidota bacterium]